MASKQEWMQKLSACSNNELRMMYLFSAFLRKVTEYGGEGEVIAHISSGRVESFEHRVTCTIKD